MSIRRAVPNLAVTDARDAAIRDFWVEGLGFEVGMDMEWITTFVAPGAPEVQVSVISRDATAPVVADISVEVGDVDAVWETMRARDVEVVYPITDELWGVRRFFVREPGGRVVNVVAHRG